MRLFSSARERRLWLWSAAVVVAIYATLGLAGTLAEVLREFELLEASSLVMFAMFLLGATIFTWHQVAAPGGGGRRSDWASHSSTCCCSCARPLVRRSART